MTLLGKCTCSSTEFSSSLFKIVCFHNLLATQKNWQFGHIFSWRGWEKICVFGRFDVLAFSIVMDCSVVFNFFFISLHILDTKLEKAYMARVFVLVLDNPTCTLFSFLYGFCDKIWAFLSSFLLCWYKYYLYS